LWPARRRFRSPRV